MGIGGLIRGAPGPVIGIVGCVLPPPSFMFGSIYTRLTGLYRPIYVLTLLVFVGMTSSGAVC